MSTSRKLGRQSLCLLDELAGTVPLGQGRANLRRGAVLRLLEGKVGSLMLCLPLANQGLAAVPDGQGCDVDETEVLDADLVNLVLRTDDRVGKAIGPGEHFRRLRPAHQSLGRVNVGTVLKSHLNVILFAGRRDVGWKCELAKGFDRPGRFGNANLVAQVRERGHIVLLGCALELPGRSAFDLRHHDVGRQRLIGLQTTFQRVEQLLVELGKLASNLQPLAPVLGGLEEAIGLHERQQLGLEHVPLLLLVGRLGHVIPVRGLVPQLQRLTQ